MPDSYQKALAEFRFAVIFHNSAFKEDTRFQSVEGLGVGFNLDAPSSSTRLKPEYKDITLKRAMPHDSKLTQWCLHTLTQHEIEPINLSIRLLDEQLEPTLTWEITAAFPIDWSISELNAEVSQVAIETIKLRYKEFALR